MDSRKFKKTNNDRTPKLKHKKKKTRINYWVIIKYLIIIFIIFMVGSTVFTMMRDSNMPSNAEVIYPTKFYLTPYGYEWNNQLYGNCTATNSNNSTDNYYFTLEQMAALASHSDNTYNYSNGIYINYTIDEKSGVKVVDKMVDMDKKTIRKPANMDMLKFSENARFISRESPYITSDFGFTSKEYQDSVFNNN